MRRGRVFFLLAVLLILILFVAFIFYTRYMSPTGTPTTTQVVPTPTQVVTVDVVVVAQPVNRGEILTKDHVSLVPYQESLVIEGLMFRNVDDVVGKRARMDLEPGLILTRGMITETSGDINEMGSDAALLIPKGMVAVSIPISRLSSVSFAPQRGDHVNVIVTMMFVDLDTDFQSELPNASSGVLAPGGTLLIGPGMGDAGSASTTGETVRVITLQNASGGGPIGRSILDPAFENPFFAVPSEMQRPRMVAQTLIQDVIVLQVGNFALEAEPLQAVVTPTPAAPAEAQAPQQAGPTPTPLPAPKEPEVITLIVSPQDAVALNYLIYSGAEMTLALRPSRDDTRVQTEAVTLQFLLDQYRIPVPAKLPFGMEPRIDELLAPTAQPTPTPAP
jgi:pilus assembly protein CpaB